MANDDADRFCPNPLADPSRVSIGPDMVFLSATGTTLQHTHALRYIAAKTRRFIDY
jgi:hypothetical protein